MIYYSTVKEKEFSESAKAMIENQFPDLQVTIVSEGGFFSNPEIYASPRVDNYPIRDLLLKYKVYRSGKHHKQDLILSSNLVIEKPIKGNFSVIVKKEGFFNRVFGGENVQLGHSLLDKRLFIQASDPIFLQSYLSDNNFQIASKIAAISDLKECKLELAGNSIDVIIRSDHTNVRYVGALLDLISILANVTSLSTVQHRASARRIFERIPSRKQQFRDFPRDVSYGKSVSYKPEKVVDITQDITTTSMQETKLLEQIKEKISDKCYFASDHKISDTSAEIRFNIGYFKTVTFNWDVKIISVIGSKELPLIPFKISMKTYQMERKEFRFSNAFEGIEVKAEPKELLNSFKERTEIARTFNRLIGDFCPNLEVISDQRTVTLSITAPAHPENIDPLYDLTQNIGWFLEFSFLH